MAVEEVDSGAVGSRENGQGRGPLPIVNAVVMDLRSYLASPGFSVVAEALHDEKVEGP